MGRHRFKVAKSVFRRNARTRKTPDALFDPAELAGVWKGVAQADFFGETVEVSYVLDITFDGKGVLTYEARDSETELLIVGFYAKDNLLVVEYVYFQGAQTSYFISFRVDGDRLILRFGDFRGNSGFEERGRRRRGDRLNFRGR